MASHPELAARTDAFLEACAARGWTSRRSVTTRSTANQAYLYRLWLNYLMGVEPSRAVEAANPYAIGDPSPWGWRTKGSKHQPQVDGYSHAEDISRGNAPVDEFHALGRKFGLIANVANEDWHFEFWTNGVLIERLDNIPAPAPEPAPVPQPRRGNMPYVIIKGEGPNDAWFAIYQSGLVRHIGGDEAGWLLSKNVEVITERDRPQYLQLIAQSGTDWRPS